MSRDTITESVSKRVRTWWQKGVAATRTADTWVRARWNDTRTHVAPRQALQVLVGILVIAFVAWVIVLIVQGVIADQEAQRKRQAENDRIWRNFWTPVWSIARMLITPTRTYLDSHTAGLAVSPSFLWVTWLVFGGMFLLLGIGRVVAGRVGWVAWGAATVAMTWVATPQPARWVAAGVVVFAWVLLSMPVLRRSP